MLCDLRRLYFYTLEYVTTVKEKQSIGSEYERQQGGGLC